MNGSSHPDPDEAHTVALLERIERRDEPALRELHRLYARRVHAFVLHRCGDDHVADTVVGDTFYEVWKKPGSFKRQSRFSTWLLGIARFKRLDELRRRPGQEDDIDDHADVLADESPIAEAVLQQAQDAALLRDCIERLSAVHRECLHLVYFEELGVNEVAEFQGVPNGTVKTRLFHARSQMRACIEARAVSGWTAAEARP
jgi:RNA polymerase sigma-70 factor (ECF subfamily)